MTDDKKLEFDSASFLTSDPFLDELNDRDLNEYITMLSDTMTTYFEPAYIGGVSYVQNRN